MTLERLVQVRRIVREAKRRHPTQFYWGRLAFAQDIREAGVTTREFAAYERLCTLAFLAACVAICWAVKVVCDWLVG